MEPVLDHRERRQQLLKRRVRWTASRKAALYEGVHQGVVTVEEACKVHRFSIDEFNAGYQVWLTRGRSALRERAIPDRRRRSA